MFPITSTCKTKYLEEEKLILCSFAQKLQLKQAEEGTMRRKKCDDFWLLGAQSFPMVYIMNGFAVIIFRCFYTVMLPTDNVTMSCPLLRVRGMVVDKYCDRPVFEPT